MELFVKKFTKKINNFFSIYLYKKIDMKNNEPQNPRIVLASIRERIAFKEFQEKQNDFKIEYISKVEDTKGWDVIILSAGTRMLCEIKVRDKDLNYDNWILEEKKYNKLIEICESEKGKEMKLVPFYINVFRNGILFWDLSKNNPEFFLRDSKKTTAEDNGRIVKSVAYLKNNTSIAYKFNTDLPSILYKSKIVYSFLYPGHSIPEGGIF